MDPVQARRRVAAFIVSMAAWSVLWYRRRVAQSARIPFTPMVQRDLERQANLNYICNSDDIRCLNLLRMRKAPFFQLCDLFRTRALVRDSIHATVEEQVAMFLHVVGHNERFRVIGLSFRRSVETISRFFQDVLAAVGSLHAELIVPAATSVHPKILNSNRWYPYFKVKTNTRCI